MSQEIVTRCTRNGVTAWQHVAAQLGCSVDQARARHDPKYLPVRPWPHPCEEVAPQAAEAKPETVDENDTSSPHVKGPGHRALIVSLLARNGPMTVADLAARLESPRNSVRMRLSQLRADGLVENDNFRARNNGVYEWTWRLTREGVGRSASFAALPVPKEELVGEREQPRYGNKLPVAMRGEGAVTGCAGSIRERA